MTLPLGHVLLASVAVVIGDVESALTRDDESGRWRVPRSVLALVWAMASARFRRAINRRSGCAAELALRRMLAPIGAAHAVAISFLGYVLVRRRRIVPARDIHVGEQAGRVAEDDTWEQHMDDAVKCGGGERGSRRLDAAFWRESLAPYAKPDLRRSVFDFATSVLAYLALTAVMYAAVDVSVLLVVVLAVPAAGFLVRTFVVFHDCAHGSFLPWRRANCWLGIACGLLVYSPFHIWRHEHAVHHASAGDLDRRGRGDVETLTVAEWVALSRPKRLAYRAFRNPLVMLGLGPIWALMIEPRLVPRSARARFGRTIIATNIALTALLAGLCALVGWRAVLVVQLPTAMLAGAAGIWMFYVQHQFEDVYWERKADWSYAEAALRGSSYLKLPRLLQFFTGNIGLHHVHHLSARIPNYNLQRAHDENPVFHDVPRLNFWDGVRALQLKLYDEDRGRMVTFRQARPVPATVATTPGGAQAASRC